MHDIFISYSHRDHDWVAQLAAALEEQGYEVWWDRELLASQDYAEKIESALNASHCIVTVWSPESVQSRWVRAESGRGFNEDKLVPVLKEDSHIPIPFGSLHTADLRGWEGDVTDKGFAELLKALEWRLNEKKQSAAAARSKPLPKRGVPVQKTKQSMGWIVGLGLLAGIAVGGYAFITTDSNPTLPKQGFSDPPANKADPAVLATCERANAQESIIQAAGRGHIERVSECLELGVDIDVKDGNHWTALHAAANSGHLEIVKLLVKADAELDADDRNERTPLYLAVMKNEYAVVHYLKTNGAETNKADKDGWRPIARASTEMKKILSE